MAPYSPNHVANFMLDRAIAEDRDLSSMKLLKLVYIGFGWNSAVLDQEPFDDPIYAWAHGPVVESLYHEFKHYGKGPIDNHSVDFNLDDGEVKIPRIPASDKKSNIVLGMVWDVYKHFSAWNLRQKTHEEGTPWRSVYKPNLRNIVIPPATIKSHFQGKIRQYLDVAKSRKSAA